MGNNATMNQLEDAEGKHRFQKRDLDQPPSLLCHPSAPPGWPSWLLRLSHQSREPEYVWEGTETPGNRRVKLRQDGEASKVSETLFYWRRERDSVPRFNLLNGICKLTGSIKLV
jgi:hypothetical protein